MKALVIVLVMIVGVNSILFSSDEVWSDSWFSLGTNFGNYFQSDANLGDFYAGSLGINFSGYGFWNHNQKMGIFFNYALLLPYQNPLAANTIESNYNQVVSADFIFGPGFRHRINEKLTLHYGIGINFNLSSFLNRESDDIKSWDERLGLGIGGDIGLKFDVTDVFFVNIGTALNFNFVNHRLAESTADNWTNTRLDSSGWGSNVMFGMRPYITFGVNMFNRRAPTQWGKPK